MYLYMQIQFIYIIYYILLIVVIKKFNQCCYVNFFQDETLFKICIHKQLDKKTKNSLLASFLFL